MRALSLLFSTLLAVTLVSVGGCLPYHYTTRYETTGTVVDSTTHKPVAGAKVTLYRIYRSGRTTEPTKVASSPSVATQTDGNGVFLLPAERRWAGFYAMEGNGFVDDLTPEWRLVIQQPGYKSLVRDLELFVNPDYDTSRPRVFPLEPKG